jgi:hypothetical protein
VLGVEARYASLRAAAAPAQGWAPHPRDYDYLIGLYREAFGHDEVVVLPYELLRDDRAKFLAVLQERLGLEPREIPVGRVNPSLTPEELHWYPAISRRVSSVASLFGERGFRWIYSRYVAHVTFRNRLAPLIRVLARISPSRRVTDEDFPAQAWLASYGRAESLRHDPLYAPYARDYLWDDEYVCGEWARYQAGVLTRPRPSSPPRSS